MAQTEQKTEQRVASADVSTLSTMLASKWKGGGSAAASASSDSSPKREVPKTGQVRSFKITKLDADKKKIDLEPA